MLVYLQVVCLQGLLVVIAVLGADSILHRYLLQPKSLQVLLTDVNVVFAGVLQLCVLD